MNDKQNPWEVSWYSNEDLPDVLLANQEEYGNSDLTQASYINWVVDKNPNGPPIFPVVREKESGRVIGWGMLVPLSILWKGQTQKIIIGFNLMVRKEYRRQGASTELMQLGFADAKSKGYQFMAALANSKSTSVHRKMGDLIGPVIPMVVHPIDMSSLAKSFIQNPFLRWIIQIGWGIARPIIFHEKHPDIRKNPIEIRDENQIGVEFDHFWAKVKNNYDLILVRDRSFLQWRFFEMPLRSYKVLTARRNDEILGYIVLRNTEIRGIKCGLVSDFMVVPGKDGEAAGLLLLNAANRQFRETKMQLGGGLMMTHTREYQIMRKAGYLRSPRKFAPQDITLVAHPLLQEIPSTEIERAESWFISNADHDAV